MSTPSPASRPDQQRLADVLYKWSGDELMRDGWQRAGFGERAKLAWLSERYRRFALNGMEGESATGQKLMLAVADSSELLGFISSLPVERRHPNLFLAAVRYRHGLPESGAELVQVVREDREAIRRVMLSRTTQTNEPARCSALLPLLARLPEPLAILEVGTSAGLCLLPDRYGYDYGASRIGPPAASGECAPIFPCAASGTIPYPHALPQIVWRMGLDLNPMDVRSDEDAAWLEALVWPGQDDRIARLRMAIDVARRDPPRIVRGDLLTDLAPLLVEAPKGATLVVFHTAVLQYVPSPALRAGFVKTVQESGAVWISNEAPGIFPSYAQDVPPPPRPGRFLIMVDGIPVAWTGPHGQSIDWFG